MTTERAASPWWEPTWRRVVGSSVVLFVVILAFLVGRDRAGADPGLARTTTPAPQSAPPAAQQQHQQTPGIDPNADPNDPFGQQTDPSIDPNPGTGGSDDNFGDAVPDGSGGSDDFGGRSGGTQQLDPPSTHVS